MISAATPRRKEYAADALRADMAVPPRCRASLCQSAEKEAHLIRRVTDTARRQKQRAQQRYVISSAAVTRYAAARCICC